jgi:type I restriction enzyme M protein
MIGVVIGDIVGSRFEWNNYRAKDFELFDLKCEFTDDTVMSLALCQALLQTRPGFEDLSEKAVENM